MATRFQIWVDFPSDQNSLSYIDLLNDPQRNTGFVSGTAASSARVNSMLRQDSLVVAALMDSIAPNSTLDLRSPFSDVRDAISGYFGQFIVSARYVSDDNVIELTLKSGQIINVSLAELLQKTIARAIADKEGNDITSTYVTKAMLSELVSNIDSLGTITTVNGIKLRFFVGTKAAYDALPEKDKTNVFAVMTDDKSKEVFDSMVKNVTDILNGTIAVEKSNSVVTKIIHTSDELMQIVTTPNQSVFFALPTEHEIYLVDNYGEDNASNVLRLAGAARGWLAGANDYMLVSFSPNIANGFYFCYYNSNTKHWTYNLQIGSQDSTRFAKYIDYAYTDTQKNTYYDDISEGHICDIELESESLYNVVVNVSNTSYEYFVTVLIDTRFKNEVFIPTSSSSGFYLSYYPDSGLDLYTTGGDYSSQAQRIYKATRLAAPSAIG